MSNWIERKGQDAGDRKEAQPTSTVLESIASQVGDLTTHRTSFL